MVGLFNVHPIRARADLDRQRDIQFDRRFVDILKHDSAWFPMRNPGLVTIPLSFAVAVVLSLLTPVEGEPRRFPEEASQARVQ